MDASQIENALRSAAAAGDHESARRLAEAWRAAQGGTGDQPVTERAHVALGGFLEGIPVAGPAIRGGLDRLGAGIRSALPGGQSYEDELAFVQGRSQELAEQHPVLDVGGQIAGGVAGMAPMMAAAPGAFGLSQASRLGRMAAGAGSGAAIGAADVAARGGDPLTGAAIGAGFGALSPAVGGTVGKFWQGLRGPKAPTVETVTKQATALYNRARAAGVRIAAPSWAGLVDDIAVRAQSAGIDPTLHPKATGVLKRLLDSRGTELTLDQTETLRRVLKGAAASIEPDERRVARIMVDRLDDWQSALRPTDVVAGDARTAARALRDARKLWSRAKRGEVIGQMIEAAELGRSKYTQSGVENALRAEFRKLSKNARQMRRFTAEEQAAIRAVANGEPLRNAMRWLGKFAPHGTVSLATGAGSGAAAGVMAGFDPLTAGAATMALGELGYRAATAGTKGAARAAQDLMLRGHALPRATSPLAGAATIAGGVQMGRQITEDEETLRLYEAARRAGYRP